MLEITSYDELHLDRLGDELSALFISISDTDATFNFLVAIMHSQLFNLLCTKADNSKGGKLKYHVRCILDEFSNIGQIPEFEKLIATIRSREISASIILQAKSQLKGGVGVWDVVNLLEGYGNDNPGAKSQGMKQLMAGLGLILLAVTIVPVLQTMMQGAV